jgi:Xaa-Pro aminopeptidase
MRIDKLGKALVRERIGGYIITGDSNTRYFTDSSGGGTLLSLQGEKPLLLTSKMNLEITKAEAKGCEIQTYERKELSEILLKHLQRAEPKTIGFDSLRPELHQELKEKLQGFEINSKPEIISAMRSVKDEEEISRIRRACEMSDAGMEAVRSTFKEGMREYEVAAELEYAMRKKGAEDMAFSTIVGSGPRAAYPHAGCTEREIRKGDFIVIDAGAAYRGYRSDITRTFIVGQPSTEQRKIYETVLKANEEALGKIKRGVKGKAVDALARKIIADAGYGELFIHSLGHGVGLDIHEAPSLSTESKDTLKIGNVVSDEPGIYIGGVGGVRIEDTVLVTKEGAERLTEFGKSLKDAIL